MFRCHRIRLQHTAIALTASAAFLLAGTASFAQVAYDAQIPFSFSSPSLTSPAGVAVAPDGTLYITDIQSSTKANLVRITPTTGTVGGGSGNAASIAATGVLLTPSGVTMKRPTAVVVDSTGALYVADGTAGIVFKIASPESSATPAATPIPYGGTQTPTALAVDSSNNLYIADQTQGAIYEVTGGVATKIVTGYHPGGLTVDSAGNVYFADISTSQIYEYNAASKSTAPFLSSSGGTNFLFSGSNFVLPVGMGVDPAGDVYIMDSANGRLIEATSGTNTFEVPFTSIGHPGSLALSSTGNIYLTDDSNKAVDELYYNNNPVNFGSMHAGTASPEVTLNYNFIADTALVTWYQSMEGDNTGEFSNPGSGTYPCGTKNFSKTVRAGFQCNFLAEVTYQASTPGLRSGADGLTDVNNDILAPPMIGTSVAGSLALYPGTQSVLSQSTQPLYEPQALAVSGNGNWLFVADEGGVASGSGYSYLHPAVWAYQVTNGVISSTPSLVGSGFTNPIGLALDGGGNLYVADFTGYVRKVPPGSNNWGSAGTYLSLPAGMLNHPIAIAIDPFGNLYIGDAGPLGTMATASNPGYIVKVPADGGPAVKLNYTVNGTPVIYPEGLTTDSYGNLFIADGGDASNASNTGGVDVVTASTGAISAISFGAYGYNSNPYSLNEPGSLNFDPAGDLYVLDSYNQRVLAEPINYSGSTPVPDSNDVSLLGYGTSGISNLLVTPSSMVVWPGGQNISIADIGYTPSTGPASPTQVITLEAFDTSVVVSTGSGILTGINTGNQQITFNAPGITGSAAGHVFTVDGSNSNCGTSTTTISPGILNACPIQIDYSGTGTHTAFVTLNGNTNDDYSVLGNVITAIATPEEPVASVSASGVSGNSTTVTIKNLGADPLIITNIQLNNPNNAILNGGSCTFNLALSLDQSCTVIVSFDGTIFSSGTVVFTDNSGGTPGTTQSKFVWDLFGGGFFATTGTNGPITANAGGSTLNAPNSNQPKSGIVNGAVYSQSQTGSSSLRQGSGAAPQGNAVQPQDGSQPVTTIQTGSTPQAVGSYLPLGLVQPSFIAPDDASASTDDSSVTSDSSTSDQDGTTTKKKNHKSDGVKSGSSSNASDAGDSAPQQ